MKEAVHKVIFLPSQRTVTAKRGEILLDVLRRESQPISAVCGGRGNCGKCKVLLDEGSKAFPPTLTEARLLTRDEIAAGYRLSCQFKVMTDVRVKTEDPEVDSAVSKPSLPRIMIREISPQVRLEEFSLSKPDIHDQASDYSRLISALVTERPRIDRLNLLRNLPRIIREIDYRGRAVMYGSEVIDILPFSDKS
ncbi:MAG: 2Fe-2S iron-sulfur cluster-binding protein, partial [Mesotoga sp.]|nr:2Fe-2S iron-sulfur cluster-binding protein [Mesotoga sp.]